MRIKSKFRYLQIKIRAMENKEPLWVQDTENTLNDVIKLFNDDKLNLNHQVIWRIQQMIDLWTVI